MGRHRLIYIYIYILISSVQSFLMKQIFKILPTAGTVVTASTGIAACNINGCTLHEWAGASATTVSSEALQQRIDKNHDIKRRWLNTKILFIDEVSMVDGDFFDILEATARAVRKDPKPFGGIQVILCGDFFQLPPVSKRGDSSSSTAAVKFCFEAKSWSTVVKYQMELTRVYRQRDNDFVLTLNSIRRGECSTAVLQNLQSAFNRVLDSTDGIIPTELYTHRLDVDMVNNRYFP